jgi:hypothetical protein
MPSNRFQEIFIECTPEKGCKYPWNDHRSCH